MFFLNLILISISLSIDAFSLAIALSPSINDSNKAFKYGIFTGLFHLFMPILGRLFGKIIISIISIKYDVLFYIVLLYIIICIIFDKKNDDLKHIISPIVFSFMVSIDSFSYGIIISKKLIISCVTFMLVSFSFTFSGFKIGNSIKNFSDNKCKLISSLLIIIVIIYNIIL